MKKFDNGSDNNKNPENIIHNTSENIAQVYNSDAECKLLSDQKRLTRTKSVSELVAIFDNTKLEEDASFDQ